MMLALLPLQVSWAVVGVYCEPQEAICIDGCYRNHQEQSASPSDVAEQLGTTSGMLDHYDYSCHAPVAFLIASLHEINPTLVSDLAPRPHEVTLSLPTLAERPERPQWLFAA